MPGFAARLTEGRTRICVFSGLELTGQFSHYSGERRWAGRMSRRSPVLMNQGELS
jgi:hypothetical protein